MEIDTRTAADAVAADDPYGEATAEFYDLLATAQWESFGRELADLLRDVDPFAGPLLDLGAGTGVGLRAILAAVPGVSVHAIEPSKAMRTALHARLSMDDELRAAVTVDPRAFATAALPGRSCALVLSAVLGHLTDPELDRLWSYVADRMPIGAPAVIEVLPPDRPIVVPPTRYRRLEVGRFVYEGWQEGEPAGDRHMAWTMTYRVLEDDRQIAEYRARAHWRCFGVDDIRDQVERYGLELVERTDSVIVSRPA